MKKENQAMANDTSLQTLQNPIQLPSYLAHFNHGGYLISDEYNEILSEYYDAIINAYNLLVGHGIDGNMLLSESILYKELLALRKGLLLQNNDGSKNIVISEILDIEGKLFSIDTLLDSYTGNSGLANIFGTYDYGSDYYTDKKYLAAGHAFSYLSDHNVDVTTVTSYDALISLVSQINTGAYNSSSWGIEDALYRSKILGGLLVPKILAQLYSSYAPGNNFEEDRAFIAAESAITYLAGHNIETTAITTYAQLIGAFQNASIVTLNMADLKDKIQCLGNLLANEVLAGIYPAGHIPGEHFFNDRYFYSAYTGAAYLAGHGVNVSSISSYQQLITAFQNATIIPVDNDDTNYKSKALGDLLANDCLSRIFTTVYNPGLSHYNDRYFNAAALAASYLAGHGVSLSAVNTYAELETLFKNSSITTLNDEDIDLKVQALGSLSANELLTRIYTAEYVPEQNVSRDKHFNAASLGAIYLAGHGADISGINTYETLVNTFTGAAPAPLTNFDRKLKAHAAGALVSNVVLNAIFGSGYVPGNDFNTDRYFESADAAADYLAKHGINLSGVTSYNSLVTVFTQNYASAIDTNLWGGEALLLRAQIYGGLMANITITNLYPSYTPGENYNTDRHYQAAAIASSYLAGHLIDLSGITTYDGLISLFQQNLSTIKNTLVWGTNDGRYLSRTFGNLIGNKVLTAIYQNYIPGSDYNQDRYFKAAGNAASFLAGRGIDLTGVSSYDALIAKFTQNYNIAVDIQTWGNEDAQTRDGLLGELKGNKVITQIYGSYVPGKDYNQDRYHKAAMLTANFLSSHQVDLSAVTSYTGLKNALSGFASVSLPEDEAKTRSYLTGTIIANEVITNIFGAFVPVSGQVKDQQFQAATAAAAFLAGFGIDLSSATSYDALINVFAGYMTSGIFSDSEAKNRNILFGNLMANKTVASLFGINHQYGVDLIEDELLSTAKDAAAYLAGHNIPLTSATSAQDILSCFTLIDNGTYNSATWGAEDAQKRKQVWHALHANIRLASTSIPYFSNGAYNKARKYDAARNALRFLIDQSVDVSGITSYDSIVNTFRNLPAVPGSENEKYRTILLANLVANQVLDYNFNDYGYPFPSVYYPGKNPLRDRQYSAVWEAVLFLVTKGVAVQSASTMQTLIGFFSQIAAGSINTSTWSIQDHKQCEKLGADLFACYATYFDDYEKGTNLAIELTYQSELMAYRYMAKHKLFDRINDGPLFVFEQMRNGTIDTSAWGADDALERNKIYGLLAAKNIVLSVFSTYSTALVKTPPTEAEALNDPNVLLTFFKLLSTGEDLLVDEKFQAFWYGIALLIAHDIPTADIPTIEVLATTVSLNWGVINSTAINKPYRDYVKMVYDSLEQVYSMELVLGPDMHPSLSWDPVVFEGGAGTPLSKEEKITLFKEQKETEQQYHLSRNYRYNKTKEAITFSLKNQISSVTITSFFTGMVSRFKGIKSGQYNIFGAPAGTKEGVLRICADLEAISKMDTVFANGSYGTAPIFEQKRAAFVEAVSYLVNHNINISSISSYNDVITVFSQINNNTIDGRAWGPSDRDRRLQLYSSLVKNNTLNTIFWSTPGVTGWRYDLANVALTYLVNHQISVSNVQSINDIVTIFQQINTGVIDSSNWGKQDTDFRLKITNSLNEVLNPSPNKTIVGSGWTKGNDGNPVKAYIFYNGNYTAAMNDLLTKQSIYRGSSVSINDAIFNAINMVIQLGAQYQYWDQTLRDPDGMTIWSDLYNSLFSILYKQYEYDFYDPELDLGLGRDDRNAVINALLSASLYMENKYGEFQQAVNSYNAGLGAYNIFGEPVSVSPAFMQSMGMSYDPHFYTNLASYRQDVAKWVFENGNISYTGIYNPAEVATEYWDIVNNLDVIYTNYLLASKQARDIGNTQNANYYANKAQEVLNKKYTIQNNAYINYIEPQDDLIGMVWDSMPQAFQNIRHKSYNQQMEESMVFWEKQARDFERQDALNNLAKWSSIFSTLEADMNAKNAIYARYNNFVFDTAGELASADGLRFGYKDIGSMVQGAINMQGDKIWAYQDITDTLLNANLSRNEFKMIANELSKTPQNHYYYTTWNDNNSDFAVARYSEDSGDYVQFAGQAYVKFAAGSLNVDEANVLAYKYWMHYGRIPRASNPESNLTWKDKASMASTFLGKMGEYGSELNEAKRIILEENLRTASTKLEIQLKAGDYGSNRFWGKRLAQAGDVLAVADVWELMEFQMKPYGNTIPLGFDGGISGLIAKYKYAEMNDDLFNIYKRRGYEDLSRYLTTPHAENLRAGYASDSLAYEILQRGYLRQSELDINRNENKWFIYFPKTSSDTIFLKDIFEPMAVPARPRN